MLTIQ